MLKLFAFAFIVLTIGVHMTQCCLITNCPRGGKRSGKMSLKENIKPCISCGPNRSGQCFGPNICCGPFGCLFGTQDSVRCQKEGLFNEKEPCLAGTTNCMKNSGRCAANGICCSQEFCYSDKSCILSEKRRIDIQEDLLPMVELYSILNTNYESEK